MVSKVKREMMRKADIYGVEKAAEIIIELAK